MYKIGLIIMWTSAMIGYRFHHFWPVVAEELPDYIHRSSVFYNITGDKCLCIAYQKNHNNGRN